MIAMGCFYAALGLSVIGVATAVYHFTSKKHLRGGWNATKRMKKGIGLAKPDPTGAATSGSGEGHSGQYVSPAQAFAFGD